MRFTDQSEIEKSRRAALRTYLENPEVKDKLSVSLKEYYKLNPTRKKANDQHLRNLSLANRRRILCINTGETFESISAASERFGIYVGNICSVLDGTIRHAKGYVFCYECKELPEELKVYVGLSTQEVKSVAKTMRSKPKDVYRPSEHAPMVDGEVLITIREFCESYANCSVTLLERRANEGYSLPNVYYINNTRWVKPSDAKDWAINHYVIFNSKRHDRPVVCLDLAMPFDSITKADKFFSELRGVKSRRSGISLVCSGKYRTCYDMSWCYADKLEEFIDKQQETI